MPCDCRCGLPRRLRLGRAMHRRLRSGADGRRVADPTTPARHAAAVATHHVAPGLREAAVKARRRTEHTPAGWVVRCGALAGTPGLVVDRARGNRPVRLRW